MSVSAREEINFWPGYVDALINVLLNLLFLVGVFTVGLVVLNMQAAMVQKELARQQIRESIQNSPPKEQVRQLQQMQETLKAVGAPAKREADVPDASVQTPRSEGMPADRSLSQESPAQEGAQQDTVADESSIRQLAGLPGKDIRIKRKAAPSPVASSEAASAQAGDKTGTTPEQTLAQWLSARILASVPFGQDQFILKDASELPDSLLQDTRQNLQLVVISEPGNPRMAREAFSRLMAVRNLLVQSGVPIEQIQIRVLSRPEGLNLPASVELVVFVLARP